MTIYKYGINQKDNVIYISEWEVIDEGARYYRIQDDRKKRVNIKKDSLDIFNQNKILYSTSKDKKEEFIKMLKEHYNKVAERYYKGYEKAKNTFEEILKVNNI